MTNDEFEKIAFSASASETDSINYSPGCEADFGIDCFMSGARWAREQHGKEIRDLHIHLNSVLTERFEKYKIDFDQKLDVICKERDELKAEVEGLKEALQLDALPFYDHKILIESEKQRAKEWEEIADSERAKSLKYRELLDLIIDPNNIHDPNRIKDAYKEALQALKDYK